jgi:hypothetical protein
VLRYQIGVTATFPQFAAAIKQQIQYLLLFNFFSRNSEYGSVPSDRIDIKYSIVLTASYIVPPEKYVSICTYSQTALKALEAVGTTSPLVQQCQKALNDIFTQHAVGLYWVTGPAGVRDNETVDELARDSSALKFVGPEPALGVSRRDIRRIRRWLVNQQWVWWRSGYGGEVLVTPKERLEN